jgi:hypothetical protein
MTLHGAEFPASHLVCFTLGKRVLTANSNRRLLNVDAKRRIISTVWARTSVPAQFFRENDFWIFIYDLASVAGEIRGLNVVQKYPQWAVVYVCRAHELISFSSTWTSRYLSLNSHGKLSPTQCECVPPLWILFRRWIEKKSITSIRHSRNPHNLFFIKTRSVFRLIPSASITRNKINHSKF